MIIQQRRHQGGSQRNLPVVQHHHADVLNGHRAHSLSLQAVGQIFLRLGQLNDQLILPERQVSRISKIKCFLNHRIFRLIKVKKHLSRKAITGPDVFPAQVCMYQFNRLLAQMHVSKSVHVKRQANFLYHFPLFSYGSCRIIMSRKLQFIYNS